MHCAFDSDDLIKSASCSSICTYSLALFSVAGTFCYTLLLLKIVVSKVLVVDDPAQFETEITSAADASQLAVVDFTAAWCGPCRMISPVLDAMSTSYPQVKFLKLDIDNEKLRPIVEQSQISGVPTFEFIKNKKTVEKLVGANKNKLETLVQRLSEQE